MKRPLLLAACALVFFFFPSGTLSRPCSFLVKGRTRVGAEMSKEPGNAYNRNSFKYSGLIGHALSVDVTPKGQAVVLTSNTHHAGAATHKHAVKGTDCERGACVCCFFSHWSVQATARSPLLPLLRLPLARTAVT